MTITEFLEARIAEDEAAARQEDEDYADTTLLPTYDSEHQARWHTTRVLAECAAKRAMVEEHSPLKGWCVACERETPCPSLKIIAAVYADHPDYQTEWAL